VIRAWIGLALLSGSWLFGLSFFHHAQPWAFALLVVAGTVLLSALDLARPSRRVSALALVLAIPAVAWTSWPYRAAPLLMMGGLALGVLPIPRQWPRRWGMGAVAAGTVLAAQGLALWAYEAVTARSHELPQSLAHILYAVARLIGIDASLDGTSLALHTMREVHALGATWELLLDGPTWCFLIGGIVLWAVLHRRPGDLGRFLLAVTLWIPVRAALVLGLVIHAALRTEYEEPLHLMGFFWNPFIYLAFLTGPVLLAARLVNAAGPDAYPSCPKASGCLVRRRIAALVVGLGVFGVTVASTWDPAGVRKAGRVMVDEHRSGWERTDRPYDTAWYGERSGYNYACIYDYGSRFYEMSRLDAAVDAAALAGCDVLIIKTPTLEYAPERFAPNRYDANEIQAIKQFVASGGGLMLVGEHTNVFNTGLALNDIAHEFGFVYRYDCLFDIDTIFQQAYRPAQVPHPIVQAVPSLGFAVSCSVDPGCSPGRAVIRSTGLKSLGADYHASNFYPEVVDRASMRYGAFIQLWARRYGAGRVMAFTDSTIFSNFAAFEQGKPEILLGMIEWLNHRNGAVDPRWLVGLVSLAALAAGLVLSAGHRPSWVLVAAVALSGWAVAGVGARELNRRGMPLPRPIRPYTHVAIDRTVCCGPLSESGFTAGREDGFGIFERWILRLGWFTSRCKGPEAFGGDLLVYLYPTQTVTEPLRRDLAEYVSQGGRVLIVDSPGNPSSSANGLLLAFGMSIDHQTRLAAGVLRTDPNWPSVPVDSGLAVKGGLAFAWLADVPVAATVRHGKGTVTVIGIGSRFCDAAMGVTGDVVPDDDLRRVFDLEFAILRHVVSSP